MQCYTCQGIYCKKRSFLKNSAEKVSDKSFPCAICGKVYLKPANLLKHQKEIHENMTNLMKTLSGFTGKPKIPVPKEETRITTVHKPIENSKVANSSNQKVLSDDTQKLVHNQTQKMQIPQNHENIQNYQNNQNHHSTQNIQNQAPKETVTKTQENTQIHNISQNAQGQKDSQGLPSFACDLCDRSYKFEYNIKRHKLMDHDKVINYKCELCDFGHYERNKLKIHLRQKHEFDEDEIEQCVGRKRGRIDNAIKPKAKPVNAQVKPKLEPQDPVPKPKSVKAPKRTPLPSLDKIKYLANDIDPKDEDNVLSFLDGLESVPAFNKRGFVV